MSVPERVELEDQGDGWWGDNPVIKGRVVGPPAPRTELGGETIRYYLVELDEPLRDANRGSGESHRILILAHDDDHQHESLGSVPAYPIDASVPADRATFGFEHMWSGQKVTVRFR